VASNQWSLVSSRRKRDTHHASRSFLLILSAFSCPPATPGCVPSKPSHSQLFAHVEIIGSRGVGVGELNKPRSVAVDGHDNLYVVDMTGRVQKFSPNGSFMLSWQMPQTDLANQKAWRVIAMGILSSLNHIISGGPFFTRRQAPRAMGAKGTNAGQFMMPRAVAEDHRDIFMSANMGRWSGCSDFSRFRIRPDFGSRTAFPPHPGPPLGRGADGFCKNGDPDSVLNGFGHAGTGPASSIARKDCA